MAEICFNEAKKVNGKEEENKDIEDQEIQSFK